MNNETAIALAIRMRQDNVGWEAVSNATGLSVFVLRCQLAPGYREHRNANIQENRRRWNGSKEPGAIYHSQPYRIKPEDALRALATVPKDTRPPFARFMGDPLPGRSALAQKGGPHR